jgi:hypothetical protein
MTKDAGRHFARTGALLPFFFALAPGIALAAQAAPAPAPAEKPATGLANEPAAAASPSDADASAQALALATQRLHLTPEQTAKVKPLLDAHVRKMRGLFEEYTGGGAAVLPSFMQEFRKSREDFRAGLQPILTAPQKTEFDTLRKEVDESLRDLVVEKRLATLKAPLTLTPEQESTLHPILKDDFEKKRALLALTTGPTGGPQASPQWLGDEVKKVQAETETRLASVLSPEQMKSYRDRLAALAKGKGAKTPNAATGKP